MAPVRAIGVPSEASKVICGGAIGSSDFDSGAVSASQPTSRRKVTQKMAKPREMRRIHLRRRVSGTGGCGGGAMSAKRPSGGIIARVGSGPSGLRNQVMLGAVLQPQYSISKWIGAGAAKSDPHPRALRLP